MNEFPYIIIKHKLRNINGLIAGIKFRDGYAVVKKNSKLYNTIKKLPLIKDTEDLPLVKLRDLKFIMRPLDVKLIYGAEVYYEYLKAIAPIEEQEKVEAEDKKHIEDKLCLFIGQLGKRCTFPSIPQSTKQYCKRHILEDVEAVALSGVKVPKMIPKQEKTEYKEAVIEALTKK